MLSALDIISIVRAGPQRFHGRNPVDSCKSVQGIIEELIRGVGYFALRLLTFGRYRGGEDSRLAEGAIGFGLVVVVAYLVYASRP